jgi:hypothetical protein
LVLNESGGHVSLDVSNTQLKIKGRAEEKGVCSTVNPSRFTGELWTMDVAGPRGVLTEAGKITSQELSSLKQTKLTGIQAGP